MNRLLLLLVLYLLPATALLAQDNAVLLSDQCLYLGRKAFLQPGMYTAYRLGLGDNSISSFHVPKGMALQVFEQDRYRGRSETFYSSVACLSAVWNNRISSVRVFYVNDPGSGGEHGGNWNGGDSGNDLPPQGNRVIFYRDIKYSGMARAIGTGTFTASMLGFLAGNVSSIYIPAGHSVEARDKNGQTRTFTSSVSHLNLFNWDNRIQSGSVSTGGSGGPGFGGGNTPPPQGDRVIFYRDIKYSGMAKDLGTGSFTSSTLGFLANNVSSIYIPYGQTLSVSDRSGRTQTFTASISNLGQYGWDNRIYSGFISTSGSSGGNDNEAIVRLYTDANYNGRGASCAEGRINYLGLNVAGQISSIQVPRGFAVTVYDGRDLKGRYRTFTTSVSNLFPLGWNDRIQSVYVFRL